MKIVFITIPGETKSNFAHRLHESTDALSLVVIQKRKKKNIFTRTVEIIKHHGLQGLWETFFYGVRLRLAPGLRKRLRYFHFRSPTTEKKIRKWPVRFIETPSVNSDAVYKALKQIRPDLLVVWGSGMIDQHILETASRSINLHMGLAPYYRGAVANQQAFLADDFGRIGATIHEISDQADAGGIIETVRANENLPVKEMFRDLNERSEKVFLDVISRMAREEKVDFKQQDLSKGKNYLMRNWTPKIRYGLAIKIKSLE